MQNCSKGSCLTTLMSQECFLLCDLCFAEPEMLEAEGSDVFFKRDEILCNYSKTVLSRCDGKFHKISTNPRGHKP